MQVIQKNKIGNDSNIISFCIREDQIGDTAVVEMGGENKITLAQLCNKLARYVLCKLERMDQPIENCYLIEDSDIHSSCERALNLGSNLIIILRIIKSDDDEFTTYSFNNNPLGLQLCESLNERFACLEPLQVKETVVKSKVTDNENAVVICATITCGYYLMKVLSNEDSVDIIIEKIIDALSYGIQEGYLEKKGSIEDA